MSTTEKKFELINRGKMAQLAVGELGDVIQELKFKKILLLSQNYRNGKVDQVTLASGIAGFCALEDLENEIKRRVQAGSRAATELNEENER